MIQISFLKYQGAGNDFILVDFFKTAPRVDFSTLARDLCNRRYGIGADGLLMLLSSSCADFRMRIFNSDGSEAAMCGNGIRCLADFIFKENPSLTQVFIETPAARIKCTRFEDKIAVHLGTPKILGWEIPWQDTLLYILDTGVPHAVLFVNDLDAAPLQEWAPKIRLDPRFAPEGVNVNFITPLPEKGIAMRTFERGVEGETLACGTGAAAAAFVAAKASGIPTPISIFTQSSFENPRHYRETMQFTLTSENHLVMIGSAQKVFSGTFGRSFKKHNFAFAIDVIETI